MPFPFRGEIRELNDAVRAQSGGSFIQLSRGVTHYELDGPEQGPPVVLVPGFSAPYYIFDPTYAALTGAGFRVLRYDLYGRGLSDRPRLRYGIDLFVGQLADLLKALGIREPVNLIGLSMGGPIAASYLVDYPDRAGKLVLIDPAGVKPVAFPWLIKVVTFPAIGEMVFGLLGTEFLLKMAANDLFDPSLVEEFQVRYRSQMQLAGFRRALLSTVRNHMLGSFLETYRRAGCLGRPIQLIWGRNDRTIPFEYNFMIRAVLPQAEFHAIDGAGHIPHYEAPALVGPLLIDFLKG